MTKINSSVLRQDIIDASTDREAIDYLAARVDLLEKAVIKLLEGLATDK